MTERYDIAPDKLRDGTAVGCHWAVVDMQDVRPLDFPNVRVVAFFDSAADAFAMKKWMNLPRWRRWFVRKPQLT